jgi:hypothetical protein
MLRALPSNGSCLQSHRLPMNLRATVLYFPDTFNSWSEWQWDPRKGRFGQIEFGVRGLESHSRNEVCACKHNAVFLSWSLFTGEELWRPIPTSKETWKIIWHMKILSWLEGWMDTWAGLDAMEERKIFRSYRESNRDDPASSPSLYLLSYPCSFNPRKFTKTRSILSTLNLFLCFLLNWAPR